MKVYLATDLQGDYLIGVYASETAAREAVHNFLLNEGEYTPEEWEEFAANNGYSKVSDFQDAIRQMPDYDEEMGVEVREEPLLY